VSGDLSGRERGAADAGETLPLFAPADPARPIAFRNGAPVSLAEFQQHVAVLAARLPRAGFMLNLCEDRYHFLAAYAAAASVGHTVLLPSSRAEQIVVEVEAAYQGSYRWDDAEVESALSDIGLEAGGWRLELEALPSTHDSRVTTEDQEDSCSVTAASTSSLQPPAPSRIAANHTVMIGFTSGSTGAPKQFPKSWAGVHASTARNVNAIRTTLGPDAASPLWVLATVPPQHMYGMELSVLLPLMGGVAVHSDRPLFPADVARALEELPPTRVLVSTPVHLRAIAESSQTFPRVALIISATAPLDQPLAAAVERKLGGRLLEMFGSTETCVFASRRTTLEQSWRIYAGVTVTPQPDGALVQAPGFAAPVLLQDFLELQDHERFVVRGRNADMIEVAGKRASLSDLTRRLLAIEGVRDAVVFQPDAAASGAIRRVAALVVAPGLKSGDILERLAPSVDAAFLPRPLVIVDALPRNEVGKLPRTTLLEALRRARR
jgi:acyl-coenzyme A synthetase/AMP-(fatty) acid ligase